MNNRYLPVLFFMVTSLAVVNTGYAQNCLTEVSYKVTNPSRGEADGRIIFQFDGSTNNTDRYVVLNLTAAGKGEREDKIKLLRHEATDLARGHYEFVIVDRKKEKCSKEISVEIKENENR